MNVVITEYPAEKVTDGEVEEIDTLLRASEAASLLSVHVNTVRNWSDLGILPSFRIGPRGDRRFRKRDLMTFLLK